MFYNAIDIASEHCGSEDGDVCVCGRGVLEINAVLEPVEPGRGRG